MSSTIIKAYLKNGDTIRRFKVSSYENFIEKMNNLLGVAYPSDSTNVKYLDDENEWIVIASEEEFNEALQCKTKDVLKIRIHEKQKCGGGQQTQQKKEEEVSQNYGGFQGNFQNFLEGLFNQSRNWGFGGGGGGHHGWGFGGGGGGGHGWRRGGRGRRKYGGDSQMVYCTIGEIEDKIKLLEVRKEQLITNHDLKLAQIHSRIDSLKKSLENEFSEDEKNSISKAIERFTLQASMVENSKNKKIKKLEEVINKKKQLVEYNKGLKQKCGQKKVVACEKGECQRLEHEIPNVDVEVKNSIDNEEEERNMEEKCKKLIEMGLGASKEECIRLLHENDNNIQRVIAKLFNK